MSASPPRSPQRRASDQLRRQTTLRSGAVGAMVGLSIVAMLGAYWWYRQWDPARDGVPSWMPDSQSLVFSVEAGTRTGDIYVMRADGSGRRNLTPESDGHEANPAVSSRGQIAFESDRDGNVEIYVMDPEHPAGARNLTNNPAEDRAPAWSPDGSHIVFTSTRDGRVSPDLYIMK